MCQTDESGNVVAIQGAASDITEHKRAEAARAALCEAILQIQEPVGLQERIDRLLQTAMTVLKPDRVHILLADPEGQMLCAVASRGVEEPLEAIQVPIGPEGGGIAQAYRTQQMVVWDGLAPLPESLRLRFPYDQIAALRSQAFVLVPMVVQGRAIGVLATGWKQSRRPLDPAMLELLRPFVALAALAIEHDRLYADSQAKVERQPRRTREMNILTMIGNAISGSLTLNTILDQALDTTLAGLEMEVGEIFLLDATRGEVSKVRHRGPDPEVFAERSCFALGEGIPGRVVQTGECIIIPNLASDRRFLRCQVVTAGFHTFSAVPLKAKAQVIGCLNVIGRRPCIVTEADLELLTAVGATVGLAVANGRLYEDLWLATKQLEAKIEDLRRIQATLIETERLCAMGQLAAGVAHDFNNALSTLLGQAQLMRLGLQQDTFSKDQLLAHLGRQEQAALDAAETVRRIRVATRPRGTEPFTAVAMNETAMDVVEITRPRWKHEPQARGAMITLRTDLAAVPPVSGREAELREALTNLLFNAVDALPHGGTITITTRATRTAKGKMVELTVSDTGIGMPEAVRARLFEPFFTTKGAKGTGLGLSMVHGIVSRHEGTIDVTSAAGKGTVVTVRLPVASEPAASPAPPPAAVSPLSSPLRVLVIDDVLVIAETLVQLLRAMGQEAEAVASGEEGLARLDMGGFDLVITDLSMPGMSGYDVASVVKARWPGFPVILTTGWLDVVGDGKLAGSMIDLVLTKPFTKEQLSQAIAQVWAVREERRSAED